MQSHFLTYNYKEDQGKSDFFLRDALEKKGIAEKKCLNSSTYAFQGQEGDDEVYGAGNSTTAEYWQYDARLGRRWNVDPLYKPYLSNYSVLGNNPILMIDPNGADWFYYQGQGEESKSWHYHDGKEATYTNTDGKEVTISNGYEHIVFYKQKGKNLWGATIGNLYVYHQDKLVEKSRAVYSGGGKHTSDGYVTVGRHLKSMWQKLMKGDFEGAEEELDRTKTEPVYEEYDPIALGQYTLDLRYRDQEGTSATNGTSAGPKPVNGLQFIPDNTKTDGGYDVSTNYGNGRIRIKPVPGQGLRDRYLYIHGKDMLIWRTHGCVCDRSEDVFDYFHSGAGKDVNTIVPLSVEEKESWFYTLFLRF